MSEVGVAFESFDEVFDVEHLEWLTEHQCLDVTFIIVLYGSSRTIGVEVCPE